MPCAENAIQAPRPSFARSSMIGLPSASSSFPVANGDVLSAPNRTHSVGKSLQVPPGVETLSLRQHPFARRCILPRLRRLPAAAGFPLAFAHLVRRGGFHLNVFEYREIGFTALQAIAIERQLLRSLNGPDVRNATSRPLAVDLNRPD